MKMKRHQTRILLLALLFLTSSAGFAESDADASTAKKSDEKTTPPSANVQIAEGREYTRLPSDNRDITKNVTLLDDLSADLKVVQADENSHGGKLSFTVILENVKSSFWSWLVGESPYWISYRTYWFIPAGVQAKPPVGEIFYKQVQPGESFSVTATAPNLDCKDFMLKARLVAGPNADPSENGEADDDESTWGAPLSATDDASDEPAKQENLNP